MRSDKTGEVIYKDNFTSAIAGIVEVRNIVVFTFRGWSLIQQSIIYSFNIATNHVRLVI